MQEVDAWDGKSLRRSGLVSDLAAGSRLGPFRFLVMGPPGSGKRTQAGLLGTRLGAVLVTSEETKRLAEICGCRQGREISLDVSWLSAESGFTIEGFPRTVDQAEAFLELLKMTRVELTAVLYYDLPLEWAMARLTNRMVCRECGAVSAPRQWPQRQAGACARCGGVLRRAARDQPKKVKERFSRYEQEAAPVLDFFAGRELLLTIEAEGCPEEVFQRTEFKLSNILPAMV